MPLPPTRYINAGPMPAQANPGPAMAAGRALEGLGQAVSGVAEQRFSVLEKVRQVKEAGAINAFMANLDEQAGKFAIDLARRSDTDNWPGEWKERTAEFRAQAKALGLSPEGMAKLDNQFTSWSAQRSIHFETQAATKALGIARMQTNTALDYYAGRRDRDGFERTLANADFLHPGEVEKARMAFDRNERHQTMQQAILADPAGWLAANPADKIPEGYDAGSWTNQRGFARERLREVTYDATQRIIDGMVEGQVTNPGQIEELAGDLRPAAREALKQQLAERQAEGFKAMLATPEYQQATVGRVAALLADYSPESESFDADFVEMDSLVRTLPLGAVRSELTRQIKAVRDGTGREVRNPGDAGEKALDVAFKAGRFGKIPSGEIMPTGRAINDGFLRDPEKLASLGFSKDQVKEILGDDEMTDSKRASMFKTLWVQRENEDATPGRVAAATARAILDGKTTVDMTDKELEDAIVSARMQAELSYGRAKTDFAEWRKLNPNATGKEVEDKIFNLAGEEARKAVSSSTLPEKPQRGSGPKGADDSTSAIPKGRDITEMIKHFEAGGAPGGFHETAYWDYGQWSIGYGTKSQKGEKISKAEGEKRLATELASHRARVERATAKVGLQLAPHQIDALTSFDYNTGSIEKLLAGGKRSPEEIADVMLLYRNAGGKRIPGLENRRAAERHLFLNGYQNA
jgi:lysozyme